MKRILFSLLIVSIVLSCSAKEYKLNGESENPAFEGITITLKTFNGKQWTDVARQTVTDNQFEFTGTTEQPVIAILSYNDAFKSLRGSKLFILENAKIDFIIDKDENFHVKGTKQNNLLQAFENDMAKIVSPGLQDSLQNNLFSENEANKKIEEAVAKQKKVLVDFSTKNVNTLVGTTIFLNAQSSMDIDDKLAVLDLMNVQTKQDDQIQAIIKQTEVEKRIAVGKPYTDFTLTDTDGNAYSLSQMIGKSDYVLIDFWASWCGPCLRTFPELTAFYNENKGNKFEILGVSLDNNEQNWKTAIEKHGLAWKHISDLKGWQSAAGQLYGVSSIPATILIDREGKIVGRNLSISKLKEIISKK